MASVAEKNLKSGWRKVKFGDVVQLSKARCADPLAEGIERYVGLEHLEPGDLRIRSWGNVADGVTFTSVFKPGQVLFGKRRAYQRKVAVADFSGVCSGDIYVMESQDAGVLLPELLPFICQTDAFFDLAVGTSAGSLSPRTNWTSLANFEFSLPPLAEQRKIRTLLLDVINAREQLLLVAGTSRNLLLSTLEDYWGGLSESSRIVGDIAIHLTSGSRGWAEHYSDNGKATFLRITNAQRNTPRLDLSDLQMVNPPTSLEATRTRVEPNDILLSVTAELGLVACVPDDLGEAYVNQHLALIRISSDIAMSKYVAWYFCSPAGQKQISRFNDSGAKAGMNLKNVAALKVPWTDLNKQESIALYLDEIESAQVLALSRERQLVDVQRTMSKNIFGGVNGI
jgi:type I restriction enzyme S subunit